MRIGAGETAEVGALAGPALVMKKLNHCPAQSPRARSAQRAPAQNCQRSIVSSVLRNKRSRSSRSCEIIKSCAVLDAFVSIVVGSLLAAPASADRLQRRRLRARCAKRVVHRRARPLISSLVSAISLVRSSRNSTATANLLRCRQRRRAHDLALRLAQRAADVALLSAEAAATTAAAPDSGRGAGANRPAWCWRRSLRSSRPPAALAAVFSSASAAVTCVASVLTASAAAFATRCMS